MLPPYGEFTLILSLLLGIISGIIAATRKTSKGHVICYLVTFILAFIISCLVEAHGASQHFFYDFGDHLLHHFAVAVIASTVCHVAVFALIKLGKSFFASDDPSAPKAYVPHAFGLMNLINPVGTVAIAIYWAINRKHPVLAVAAKQAFTFQLIFTVLIGLLPILTPRTGFIAETLGFLSLIVIVGWVVLTIMAIVKARKNPHFSYPLLGRRGTAVTPAS